MTNLIISELLDKALDLVEEINKDLKQIKASHQPNKASEGMYKAAKNKAGIH